MRTRSISIILILLLCMGLWGCEGMSFTYDDSDGPAATADETADTPEPTEAPTPEPTPEQKTGLTFTNGLSEDIAELYISSVELEDWGECMGEVPAGESAEFEFDRFPGEPGSLFDLGVLDINFMNYDAFDIPLNNGDEIELRPDGDCFFYVVTHADGSEDTYEADVYPGEDYEGAVAIEIELENYREYRDATDDAPTMYVDYTLAHLGSEYFDSMPELAGAMEEACDSRRDAMEQRISWYMDISREQFEAEGGVFGYCSYEFNAYVRRADNRVVSVLYEEAYSDSFGTIYHLAVDNFDARTGERLVIEDVVAHPELLVGCINDKLTQFGSEELIGEDVTIASYLNDTAYEDVVWTPDHEGLTVYFNFYGEFDAIVDYCESVTLPYDEYPELGFNYVSELAEYAVAFPYGFAFYANIDGEQKQIYVCFDSDYEEWYDTMVVYLDWPEEEYDFSEMNFDRKPVYVRTGEGSFLYVFGFGEYDEECLFIYKLTSDGVEKVGEAYVTECTWAFESEDTDLGYYDYYVSAPITDPQNIILSEYFDMLGTMVGSRSYFAYDNCMPVSYDCFWFYEEKELELQADITLTEVDYDGDELGEAEVAAGTSLMLLRSDGETWVDFCTNDGRILRAYVVIDWEQGEPTINGMSIYTVFNEEDIVFAG